MKFRSAAELYREKALQVGIDMSRPDESPSDRTRPTSRRERVAAMFRVFGVNGASAPK
ncbi:MAG: hypothetical protein V7604_2412 [Hyphomicrobiales bacterium]